jgi:hypothetical protein
MEIWKKAPKPFRVVTLSYDSSAASETRKIHVERKVGSQIKLQQKNSAGVPVQSHRYNTALA